MSGFASFMRFEPSVLKLSVGRTCPFYLLNIEGLLTQGSHPMTWRAISAGPYAADHPARMARGRGGGGDRGG
jgi:hypothetical protein